MTARSSTTPHSSRRMMYSIMSGAGRSGGSPFGLRIERVVEAIADEVERQHRHQQRHSGKHHVPPLGAEVRARVGNHLAPAGGWWLDSDPEVRERSLEQDVH